MKVVEIGGCGFFGARAKDSPKEDGSHWHYNGDLLYLIDNGMGDGMVRMLGGK